MTRPTDLTPLAPAAAKAMADGGEAVFVDIREANEHARERIAGAVLVPLSTFTAAGVTKAARGKRVIFHCQSGLRTAGHAHRLAGACRGEAYVLAGGINAWKAAGLPIA